MPRLDELLSNGLKQLSEPVDRGSLLERVERRKAHRLTLRRIQGGSLAIAVLAGSVLGTFALVRVFDRAPEQRPARPPATDSPFDDLPPGWTQLPPPPEVPSAAAIAWTGQELVVWGGIVYFSDEDAEANGFAFDARSRKWAPIASGPLEARSVPAAAWTGRDMLVWGGQAADGTFLSDGAAYDPENDSWRTLPPAPIGPRAPLSVWTGREFVVWGTAARVSDRPTDGAAYDPSSDSWRKIADAPIELTDATAVWTGSEMIVFGAALHGGNTAETETAIGAAYDPATDTWRRLPDSELSPQASTAAWNGREMVAWDYLNGTAAYDPESDRWRLLANVPLDDYECFPRSVAVDGRIFGEYCGLSALFEPAKDRWRDISRRELLGWGFTLVPADPAVVLLGRNADTREERMLAYRPTAADPVDDGSCAPPLPFDLTYLPPDWGSELRPGSVGGYAGAVGHYASRRPGGGAFDVHVADRWGGELEGGEAIRILGTEGKIGRFYDGGVWVEFSYSGCRYVFWGFSGLGEDAMRRIAAGLVPV